MICTAHQMLGDQMKENEMAGTCAMYWGEERWIQGFGGTPEGERPLG